MSGITTTMRALASRASLVLLAAIFMVALVSCGSFDSAEEPWSGDGGATSDVAISPEMSRDSEEMAAVAPPPPDGAGPDASTVPEDDRLVIRSLGMRVQVEEVEPAIEGLRDAVESVEGMVTAVQVTTDDTPVYRYDASGTFSDGTPLQGYLTARIPPANIERFIASVSDLGKVLRQAEDESDVTQEYIDLSARLENLRAQELRLRELFDRGEEVEDLLAVERELARVRGDIESYEARVAYLERQAAMATVTVELVGRQPVIAPSGEDWGVVAAVRAGIRGFVNTINGLIFIALSVLPLVALAVVVFLIARTVIRRRRERGMGQGDDDTAEPSRGEPTDEPR